MPLCLLLSGGQPGAVTGLYKGNRTPKALGSVSSNILFPLVRNAPTDSRFQLLQGCSNNNGVNWPWGWRQMELFISVILCTTPRPCGFNHQSDCKAEGGTHVDADGYLWTIVVWISPDITTPFFRRCIYQFELCHVEFGDCIHAISIHYPSFWCFNWNSWSSFSNFSVSNNNNSSVNQTSCEVIL